MSMQQQEGKLPENTVNKDNKNVVNSTEKKEDNVNAVNSDEKKEEQYELDVLRPFNEVNTNNDTNNINNSLDVDRKSEKETLKNNDNKNNNKEQQKAEGSPVVAGNNINLSKNNDISSSVSSNVAESDGIKKENDAVYNDKNVLSSMERFKNDINNNYEDYRKIRLGSLLDKKYEKDSEIEIDNLREDFERKLKNNKEYQNAKKATRKSTAAIGVVTAIAISPAGAALLPFAAICIGVLFASSMYHTSKAKKILEKHKAKMEKMKENIKLDKEINKMSNPRLQQYYKYKEMIKREEKEIDDIAKKAKEQKEKALDEIKKSSSLKKNESMKKNNNLNKNNNNIVNKGTNNNIKNKNNKQNAIVNNDIKKDDKAKDNSMDKKDVEVKNEKNGKDDKVEKKENLANEVEKNKEKVNNIEDKKEKVVAKRILQDKKAEKNINKDKDLNLKESIAKIGDVNKNNKEQEKKLNKNVEEKKDIVINLNKDIDGINNNKENLKEKMEIKISRDQEENKQQVKSGIETKIKVSNDANIGL